MSKIKTPRLVLRQFGPSDLNSIFAGLSNKDVIKYYGVKFDSLETTKEQMEWYSSLEKNSTGKWWAVCDKFSDDFMGAIGLNDIDKKSKKGEVGFWLLPQNWRKGYIREAMPEVINYGFSTVGLHRIEAWVESGNKSCKQTLKALGFQQEGTLRDCEIKDGKFISLDVYSVINNL